MNYARAQLKTVTGLADRMASLMAITSKAVHLLTVKQFHLSRGESKGRVDGGCNPPMRSPKCCKCMVNALFHYPCFQNFLM